MSKDTDLKALVTAYTDSDSTIASRGKYIHRLVTVHKMTAREVAEYVTANVDGFKLNHVEVTTHVNTRKATGESVTTADYASAYRAVKSAVRDGDTPRKKAILDALTAGDSVADAVTKGEAAGTKGKYAPESTGEAEVTAGVTAETLLKRLDAVLKAAGEADEVTRRAFEAALGERIAAFREVAVAA